VWIAAKTDDALRSAVVLARAWPDRLVKADELAAAEGRPIRFLENVLGDLRRAGLVRGRRGCCGGYALMRPPERITALDILHAIGSPIIEANRRCARDDGVSAMWGAIDDAARDVLQSQTLADLARERCRDTQLSVS
jgi:Rrf2 family protein